MTDDRAPLRRPALVELDDATPLDPGLADALPDAPVGRAMQGAVALVTRRGSRLGRLTLWAVTTAVGFLVSVATWEFVAGLLAQNALLGGVAVALLSVALLLVALMSLREWRGYLRLGRIEGLRSRALMARTDLKAAREVVASLEGLYAARADQGWGLARLRERAPEVMDADTLLDLAEVELMAPLDRAALAEVEAASRQVALVTALVPLALADVATALFANLRMIRRLSEIYGGRSSSFGNLRLLRRVFAALLGAGAVALADDMVGSFASGGILSRLSRRFGEGVVNGALTARVGLAAMEACRPMPFAAVERPGTSATVSRALAGFLARAKAEGGQ